MSKIDWCFSKCNILMVVYYQYIISISILSEPAIMDFYSMYGKHSVIWVASADLYQSRSYILWSISWLMATGWPIATSWPMSSKGKIYIRITNLVVSDLAVIVTNVYLYDTIFPALHKPKYLVIQLCSTLTVIIFLFKRLNTFLCKRLHTWYKNYRQKNEWLIQEC